MMAFVLFSTSGQGHMNNNETDSLFQFPCVFPIKVMGKNTDELYPVVSAIMEKHVPGLNGVIFESRLSSRDKYLSITVTFTAQSRAQLDAIYLDLNRHEMVLMTL
jgi:putative lipoic acid-binding regulatory protein